MITEWMQSTEGVDWHELSELYRIAPLGDKSPDWLQTAYSNSMFKSIGFEQGRIVAAGRAIADGVDCSYLCDIVVHPSRQGQGLGSALIRRLVEFSRGHRKVILYAVPGREAFYARFGFRRMNTAMALFADPGIAERGGYIR